MIFNRRDLAPTGLPPAGGSDFRIALAPNPVRGGSVFLEIPVAGGGSPLDVSVYDLRGRLVRTLHRGPADAPRLSLTWDGRSDLGRPASSGVYFVRAVEGNSARKAKLFLVR